MRWRPAIVDGIRYDLTHVHPFQFELLVPAKGADPERRYQIHVGFSMHTFTREPKRGEGLDPGLSYASATETRLFDPERYQLSFKLREIIEGLDARQVFHTRHGNFFTVEVVGKDGEPTEYAVYFDVVKGGRGGRLRLYVRSAYVQDRIPRGRPQPRKPIKMRIIAYNVTAGIPIKVPK